MNKPFEVVVQEYGKDHIITIKMYEDYEVLEQDYYGEFISKPWPGVIYRQHGYLLGDFVDEELPCPDCDEYGEVEDGSGNMQECLTCEGSGWLDNPEYDETHEGYKIVEDWGGVRVGHHSYEYFKPMVEPGEDNEISHTLWKRAETFGKTWGYIYMDVEVTRGDVVVGEAGPGFIEYDFGDMKDIEDCMKEMISEALYDAGLVHDTLLVEYMPGY